MELRKIDPMTYLSHVTAAEDDDDDDKTTSSVRRLIDVIMTSERLQSQWNAGNVQHQLQSNDVGDESVVLVGRKVKLLLEVRMHGSTRS